MASPNVIKVTDSSFQKDVAESNVPVLLDFTATWCGPCKALAPIVEEVAKEFDGKLRVGKLDIDDSPEVAQTFGIRGVPTVIVFKSGKEVRRSMGLMPKAKLIALFSDQIG